MYARSGRHKHEDARHAGVMRHPAGMLRTAKKQAAVGKTKNFKKASGK